MDYKDAFFANHRNIFLGTLGVLVFIIIYTSVIEKNEELSKVIEWPESSTAYNLKCSLKTKYYDGKIFTQLNLGLNDSLKFSKVITGCKLQFLDNEYFLIKEFDFLDLTKTMDENGKIVGYQANESFSISKDEYQSYSKYDVSVYSR